MHRQIYRFIFKEQLQTPMFPPEWEGENSKHTWRYFCRDPFHVFEPMIMIMTPSMSLEKTDVACPPHLTEPSDLMVTTWHLLLSCPNSM